MNKETRVKEMPTSNTSENRFSHSCWHFTLT